MTACRLPRPGFRHQCSKVRGSRKEDEEVRGDEPQIRCFKNTTQNVTNINTVVCCLFFFGGSLSLPTCAHHCSLLPVCRPAGPFSCLSDNHWNQIQVLIIIHLPTVSPLVSEPALPLACSVLPTPPSPQNNLQNIHKQLISDMLIICVCFFCSFTSNLQVIHS